MKKFLALSCTLILITIGSRTNAQQARIVKFGELSKMMSAKNDTTYVFNFFATWCQPCVEEFPAFQRFSARYAIQKMRLIFVSLDFKKDFMKRLLPFLKKHRVKSEAVLLDEPDYNSWIDKVDSTWNGDLPATLVINNGKDVRQLFAREFTFDSLEATMKPFLP
ncbi:MAG TPA: TlpA disulfide reductase family protein [Candidatus Kapabacteria bacterium]|nr:TlpA disulfide reductase family protein [Candidatus Kapabacteria bacterium]